MRSKLNRPGDKLGLVSFEGRIAIQHSNDSSIYAPIAIAISILLTMGALAFLMASSMGNLPDMLLVPPLIQLSLGIVGIISSLFLWRGNRYAWIFLAIVTIGVVANVAFLIVIAVRILPHLR